MTAIWPDLKLCRGMRVKGLRHTDGSQYPGLTLQWPVKAMHVTDSDQRHTVHVHRSAANSRKRRQRAKCTHASHQFNSHVILHYNSSACQPTNVNGYSRRQLQPFRRGLRGPSTRRTLPTRQFAYFSASRCKMTLHATASGLFRFHQLMAASAVTSN